MKTADDKRQIRITDDGSPTLYSGRFDETYHSHHGAVTESVHVFLRAGLETYARMYSVDPVRVGETGFGTGLNAWLAWRWAMENKRKIIYETYEIFPLEADEYMQLEFFDNEEDKNLFFQLHRATWERETALDGFFTILKRRLPIEKIQERDRWDVLFFDAFSPRKQPELWNFEVLKNMYLAMRKNGIFVTYSAKGEVRRNLIKAGFEVERIPGPPGKRHMLRAWKR